MSRFSKTIQRLFGSGGQHSELPRDDIFWTQNALWGFAAIVISAMFCYSLYAASALPSDKGSYFPRLMGVFGTLTAVGFAAFGVGGILGFLFGIPKSVSVKDGVASPTEGVDNDPDDKSETPLQSYRSNSNLEEISDWLTKIIVGATLIEFRQIKDYLGELISTTAAGLETVPFATTISGAVIIGFSILGFFAIYLMTRLYLASAFSRLEDALRNANRKQEKIQATIDMKFDDLSDIEKQELRKLLSPADNVLELPADFARHSPDHMAWESLRERGLVQLRPGGRWRPGSIVTLTELGKSLREKLQSTVAP